MTDLPVARRVLHKAPDQCNDLVVLTYDERLLRRRRLETVHGDSFLVDLAEVTNMDGHWGFALEDGRMIEVVAAEEPVLEVRGPDLARLAWHIGNRHTPCQIEPDRLVIRQDHVLRAMLEQLGATVTDRMEPFAPEQGAYGMGRPMGHDHGHAQDHDHHRAHVHHHSSHGPAGAEAEEEADEAREDDRSR